MFWLIGAAAAIIYGIFEFGRISTLYHFFKWGMFIALGIILVQLVIRAKDRLQRSSLPSEGSDVSPP